MLSSLLESWSAFYSDHAAIRTLVAFVHIGGLVAAGGSAMAADLSILRAMRRGADARATQLATLTDTHPIVVFGLAALTVSGVLLFAADVDTFLTSRVFWGKMLLLAVLLGNGLVLLRAERLAAGGDERAWQRLRQVATASLVLWVGTTLVGAALPNLG